MPIAAVNSRAGRAVQPSIADRIDKVRKSYPDALVCVKCGRLLATRRPSYAKSDLSEAARLSYVCAGCRSDTDSARSAEVTERFAASKTAAASALSGFSACSCTDRVTCSSCLQTRAAEVAEGRRVAEEYLNRCARDGRHQDLDALAVCEQASATVAAPVTSPVFCAHGRPAENCIAHARRAPATPMPPALARCEACWGWDGKSGERCPYSREEAKAIKAAREQRHQNLAQKAQTGLRATSGQGRADASCNSLNSYGLSEGVTMTVQSLKRDGAFFRTTRQGGRPRGRLTRQQQLREASRRYRQRRAGAQVTRTV
jgi:hypothetical protein